MSQAGVRVFTSARPANDLEAAAIGGGERAVVALDQMERIGMLRPSLTLQHVREALGRGHWVSQVEIARAIRVWSPQVTPYQHRAFDLPSKWYFVGETRRFFIGHYDAWSNWITDLARSMGLVHSFAIDSFCRDCDSAVGQGKNLPRFWNLIYAYRRDGAFSTFGTSVCRDLAEDFETGWPLDLRGTPTYKSLSRAFRDAGLSNGWVEFYRTDHDQ